MKIIKVLDALEKFAPLPLEEDYDNAGLQCGLTEVEVSGALLCLDVTEAVIDEAISKNCNLIVSHHPLIFHKLRHVGDTNYVERCVRKAIKNDITIFSMHTNMDAATGGVNYRIAQKLGLSDVTLLDNTRSIYGIEGGDGVIGQLPEPVAADDLILNLKERFGVECVECNQLLRRDIRRVALCGGAGAFLLPKAISMGADAFITGEMSYHDFFGHEQEIQLCVIGHYQSEQFTPEIFRDIINDKCSGVRCEISQTNTNPILYM